MGDWYGVCASLAVVTPVMPAAGVGVLSWPEIALVGELFKRYLRAYALTLT